MTTLQQQTPAENQEELLRVEELTTIYRTRRGEAMAVDGVSLTLHRGHTLGLVGESGCGKSTLIKSLIRLLPRNATITAGRVLLSGTDLLTLDPESMRQKRWTEISLITQSAMNALNPVYRIGDQMVEAILTHRRVSRTEARRRVEEVLSMVGIHPQRFNDYPHQFSGGMRQRVIIAMALLLKPSLIIADEPTTALDVIVQAQVLNRIRDLQRSEGNAMILVTHDIAVVAQTCERVAVMYAGKVVESGRTVDVLQQPCHPYTMGLRNAFPTLSGDRKKLVSIPGAPPDLTGPLNGCRFAPRCPFAVKACREEDPPLREIAPGHQVACHRLDEAPVLRALAEQADTWEQVVEVSPHDG